MSEEKKEDWLSAAMTKQAEKVKAEGKFDNYRQIRRIVSYTRYAEAEKAQNAGATPRQIEMCLAGATWDWVKENHP